MIDILTNGFLTNPVPIQYTGNYCSHNCSYCFSNINSPNRKVDLKAVVSQLKNYQKRNDAASQFMRLKYPILISNNIDPFSKSNQPYVNDLIFTLQDIGVPVVVATRGGIGWQEVAKNISKSVWYVSIPYENDNIRKIYEPNATSMDERYFMATELKKMGHEVIIAINPLNKKFNSNPLKTAEFAKSIGVYSLLINKIHLSPKQQSNMTAMQKSQVGEDLLVESRLKNFTDEWLDTALQLNDYCIENDMQLMGLETGLENNTFIECQNCYENVLPTVDDFFNWIANNKKENDLIYFSEFYNFFSKYMPDFETNISKYIFQKAVIEDKSSYKTQKFSNLLHYYWEVKGVEIGFAKNYPVFSWAKKQYSNKQDFIRDSENNRVLIYTPTQWNTKDYLIIE